MLSRLSLSVFSAHVHEAVSLNSRSRDSHNCDNEHTLLHIAGTPFNVQCTTVTTIRVIFNLTTITTQ